MDFNSVVKIGSSLNLAKKLMKSKLKNLHRKLDELNSFICNVESYRNHWKKFRRWYTMDISNRCCHTKLTCNKKSLIHLWTSRGTTAENLSKP